MFDEADIELHAENILIVDGGTLQVGTEEEPFQHEATIMMHGHLRSQELPLFGAKTLAVRNGTLDLHGESKLDFVALLTTEFCAYCHYSLLTVQPQISALAIRE